MKKAILPSIITVVAITIVSVNSLVHAESDRQRYVEPTSTKVAQTKPPEVAQQPKVNEVVNEPSQNAEQPQRVLEVPTNEDLKAQYGWTNGSNLESINFVIDMFPKYFTDSQRVNSFAYLNAIATSNKTVGSDPKTINSIDFVKWYFQEAYQDESWVNVGILAGVDWSLYQ